MFEDRYDAGRQLAERLTAYKDDPNALVLAIPRGGLEIGYLIATMLQVPLDIVLAKKIGFPGNPEFAIGAVSAEDALIDRGFAITPPMKEYIDEQIEQIRTVLAQRARRYRGDREPLSLEGKTVIVTDDGIATGRTLQATIGLIKRQRPAKIVVAIPVGPAENVESLRNRVDEVICLQEPVPFFSIGQFYKRFEQISDDEAIELFHKAQA